MSKSPIKFHRSEYSNYRIHTNNGRGIVSPGYISAAIDKEADGYTVRLWAFVDGRPTYTRSYKLQSEARAVVIAVLEASLLEEDRDLRNWLSNEFHRISMPALEAVWAKQLVDDARRREVRDAKWWAEHNAVMAELRKS